MKCRRALTPLKVIRWMAFFVYGTLVFWIARVFNPLILKLMTSIKLKFRPSKVNGKLGTLYFQVIHDRLTRQIGTGYKAIPMSGETAD